MSRRNDIRRLLGKFVPRMALIGGSMLFVHILAVSSQVYLPTLSGSDDSALLSLTNHAMIPGSRIEVNAWRWKIWPASIHDSAIADMAINW